MRHWPLSVKLWGIFTALMISSFALLAVLLPWLLKGFFTEQLYDILLDSQQAVRIEPAATAAAGPPFVTSAVPPVLSLDVTRVPDRDMSEMRVRIASKPASQVETALTETARRSALVQAPEGPVIKHMMIVNQGTAITATAAATPADPLVRLVEQDALVQQEPIKKYARYVEDKPVFYVIRKEQVEGNPGFMVSYASGNYRNDLVMTMFGQLALLMVALIVLSWLPCLGLAKYLTRPLVQMERHVGRLARRDWHEPLETGRKDEIGRLGSAIESMRQQLVRQDKAQQFFLQNISHELKTPVMVIRSYAQSIMDGVFPRKTLAGSVDVIMKEAERLEKRIRDLLYLNKLNYFTSRGKPHQPFDLKALLDDTVDRLRCRRADIAWEVHAPEAVMLTGDREQWSVALENLADNQLRYAQTGIRLEVKPGSEGAPSVRLWNDGPPLDEETAQSLFEPFRTGGDGQFGLGLAIVRQIAVNHGYTARAVNEEGGVAFYLEPAAAG